MRDREEQKAMLPDQENLETVGPKLAWFGWMLLFGVLGILATIGIQNLVRTSCERDELCQSHAWMMDQMEQLRRGEINCFVNPDPWFVAELLGDAACAAKVRDLYLGGDLSDPRLGRLRELPNLKCIIFLFADNHGAFLQRMCGKITIEELTFDHTRLARGDVDQISSFSHLKSLHIESLSQFSDLDGLRGHPSLERLSLAASAANKGMIPLFQSMPHLRDLGLGVCHDEKVSPAGDSFEKRLAKALPGCKCRVWEDDR